MKTKRLIALCLAMSFTLCGFSQALAADFKVKEGTLVRLKLLQSLSSKNNHEGDVVSFSVVEDVKADDKTTVLIKSGSEATGTITHIEKNGGVGKPGELGLTLDYVKAVDGSKIALRANMNEEGEAKRGSSIALGVVAGIIFLPGFLFLMKKGKNAEIPEGAQLNSYVNSDSLITIEQTSDASTAAAVEEIKQPQANTMDSNALKEIETLGQLRDKGLITKEEFEAKKKQLLGL